MEAASLFPPTVKQTDKNIEKRQENRIKRLISFNESALDPPKRRNAVTITRTIKEKGRFPPAVVRECLSRTPKLIRGAGLRTLRLHATTAVNSRMNIQSHAPPPRML